MRDILLNIRSAAGALIVAAAGLAATNPAAAQAVGTLDWSSQGLTSAAPLPNPFIVSSGGRTLTITTSTQGAGPGIATVYADFVTFNTGALSGPGGIGVLAFNNNNVDNNERIIFEMTFDEPVANLAFDVQDIDQTGAGDDAVVVSFDDGTGFQTLRGTPFVSLSGASIIEDNAPGFDGWEGNGASGVADSAADLQIDFGAQEVIAVRIELFNADDSPADPGNQFAGISDISWTTPPGADLSLSLVASDADATLGDPTALTLTVMNDGALATSGVAVSLPLAPNLRYASANGGGAYDPVAEIWSVPGALAAGESQTLIVNTTVNSTASSFTIRGEVTASAVADPDSVPGNAAAAPFEDDTASVVFTPGFGGGGTTPPPLGCGAASQFFEWESNPYPPGSLSQTYTVNGLGFDFAFTGATDDFVPIGALANSPGTDDAFTGGITADNSLLFAADYDTLGETITLTIDIGASGVGVSELQFVIFDVDFGAGTFQDEITITGSLGGGATIVPLLTPSASNVASGSVAQGGSVAVGSTSGDANVTATFSQAVDQVRIIYDNGPDAPALPGLQAIALHDLEYCEALPPPDLSAVKTTAVFNPDNPSNPGNSVFAVPGNDVTYTITVTNSGDGVTDPSSILLIDELPAEVEFFNGDVDGPLGAETAAVAFNDQSSGLTFDAVTDVRFSNTTSRPPSFLACSYSPLPAPAYDPAVRFICLNPKGVMAAGDPDPSFSLTFRARIK